MTSHDDTREAMESRDTHRLSLEQLRDLQYSVAATIMPVTDGWRVHYFSVPDFDTEPGTTFPTYEAAMSAIDNVLLVVNSPEKRAQAAEELRERLHSTAGDSAEGDARQEPPNSA